MPRRNLGGMPHCALGLSAGVSMTNGSTVAISWTTEIADAWNMHATNATSIIVPYTGLWQISIRVVLNVIPAGASTWFSQVLRNGAGTPDLPAGWTLMSAVGFNYTNNVTNAVYLTANDVLTVSNTQNSGATGTISTASCFIATLLD